jgi:exosortase/archaeosortase family protein
LNREVENTDWVIYSRIILVAAIAFIILPFVTSFNELLTKIVESLRLVSLIQGLTAPFLVKIIIVLLRTVGIPAAGRGSYLYITRGLIPTSVYISWNCMGWQSFILLAFTMMTGLQGPYNLRSKLITLLLGVEGTFIINLIRILIPILLAHYVGYLPAILFHDYFGTVITLIWFGGFWYLSSGSLLVGSHTRCASKMGRIMETG